MSQNLTKEIDEIQGHISRLRARLNELRDRHIGKPRLRSVQNEMSSIQGQIHNWNEQLKPMQRHHCP